MARNRWTKETIIRELKRLYSFSKENVLPKNLCKVNGSLYQAAMREFGTYQSALNESDCEIVLREVWTKEKILDKLISLSSDYNQLIPKHLGRSNGGLYNAARKEFGTYEEAIKSAGLDFERLNQISYNMKISKTKKWTKEIIIEEILKLNKCGVDISYNSALEANQALVVAASRKQYFGSWRNAVLSAGIEYRDRRERDHPDKIKSRIWSEEKILFEMQKLKDAAIPLNADYIQKNYRTIYAAAFKYFKSWGNAIEHLGLNYKDIRLLNIWTEDGNPKDKVLFEIIKTASESQINSAYIQENNASLFTAAQKYFGNWRNAVEAAGFNYDEILRISAETRIEESRIWSEEKVIEEIIKCNEWNIELHFNSIRYVNSGLLGAALRYFGSWEKAIECAGLNYNAISKSKPSGYWSEEKVLDEIKSLHGSGTDLNYLSIFSNHNDLLCAARKVFGAWESAVTAAGFDYESFRKKSKDRDYSKTEIIEYIQKLYKTGKEINALSVFDLNHNIYHQATKKFGSWKNVIEEAGFKYDDIKKHGETWTKERIVQEIKELKNQNVQLNDRYVRQLNRFLYHGARTHFGSWEKAISASGINYDEIRKEISKEILFGKIFEQKCKEMFNQLGYRYIYQPRFIFESEICIPDFIDEEDVWVDIKLHSWTSTIELTKEKYLKYTDFLRIIYLNGNHRESEGSVAYVPIDYFYPFLIDNALYELIEQFELLKKGVIPR